MSLLGADNGTAGHLKDQGKCHAYAATMAAEKVEKNA
jgi:ribosomal protein S11